MRKDNFLSVCMFQLKVHLDCDSKNEYLIETEEVLKQMENAFSVIEKLKPDISLFPEMTYMEKYKKRYENLSLSGIIIAGSYYKEGINTTVVFAYGKKYEIIKDYASGAEPMARRTSFITPEEL